jgi:anti-sigma factor RsiW
MTAPRTVSETELHAYVDGALDEADHARVERYLSDNPDLAETISDWQRQNDELRTAFARYEMSKISDLQLLAPQVKPDASRLLRRAAIAAAAAGIFVLGAVGGHYGPMLFESEDPRVADIDVLPHEAREAFLVYAGEVRHPVEVFADQEAHLATWLGKRLAIANLKVPNLQSLGFRLVGGRLLPVAGKAGAMFMYEDETGRRLTVLVGRNKENRTTSFRFASADTLETFYWIDGELGYAVTGEISRDMLQKIAEECYRQFPS